jgi:hypothetical protein
MGRTTPEGVGPGTPPPPSLVVHPECPRGQSVSGSTHCEGIRRIGRWQRNEREDCRARQYRAPVKDGVDATITACESASDRGIGRRCWNNRCSARATGALTLIDAGLVSSDRELTGPRNRWRPHDPTWPRRRKVDSRGGIQERLHTVRSSQPADGDVTCQILAAV